MISIKTAEYLDQARHFERLAAKENDPELKVELERHADVCRRLAAVAAKHLDEPPADARPK